MLAEILVTIDGKPFRVNAGTSVAAAILMARAASRVSVGGGSRTPFCGMGVCMECRATVNGVTQQQTCQRTCEAGMEICRG